MLVVGYQEITLVKGINVISPVFESLDSNGFDIQNLKLIGAPGGGLESIQILNSETGYPDQTYVWYDADNTGYTEDCWFDMDGTYAPWTDVKIKPTEAIFIVVDNENIKLRCSGGVRIESQSVPLSAGINVVGVASPVEVDLQKFKLIGAPGGGLESIQILNPETGYPDQTYVWYDADNTGYTEDCWFDMDGTYAPWTDVKIMPGQGLFIMVGQNGIKLEIPSLKDAQKE